MKVTELTACFILFKKKSFANISHKQDNEIWNLSYGYVDLKPIFKKTAI